MGKDTLADHLVELLNKKSVRFKDENWPQMELTPCITGEFEGGDYPHEWTRAAFAYNVKKVYMDTFGVDMDFIEEWKVKDEIPPGFTMNCRQGLQFIGDGFRKIQPEIWVDLAFRYDTPKIISDVRYINEFKRIKQEGGINILVGRTEKLNDDPNGSEAIIRPYVEWALNNIKEGELDQLQIASILGATIVGKVASPSGFGSIAAAMSRKNVSDAAPPDMNLFDIFVRNDGTKEEFLKEVEDRVVPLVEKFQFGDADDPV
jgi:hypothetical protein